MEELSERRGMVVTLKTIAAKLFLLSLIAGLMIAPAGAQTTSHEPAAHQRYFESHQAGVRLGGWSNQGDTPPDSFDLSQGGYYKTDIGSGSVVLEGFFGYRLSPSLMLEFSLSLVSRGDVTLVEPDGGSSIGTVQLYPMLVKLKLYPLGRWASKFQPYLAVGGGIYYGRHDIQITSGYDAFFRQNFGEDSETDFNYVLAAGLDWPVASAVALNLQAQYMPIKFSGELVGVRDYTALTITVGVQYLFTSKDEEKRHERRRSRRGR